MRLVVLNANTSYKAYIQNEVGAAAYISMLHQPHYIIFIKCRKAVQHTFIAASFYYLIISTLNVSLAPEAAVAFNK